MTKLYWFIFKKRKKNFRSSSYCKSSSVISFNFIFDFGNLTGIILRILIKISTKKDYEMIQNLAIEVIIESQNFIRNNEEIYSVSLREIED